MERLKRLFFIFNLSNMFPCTAFSRKQIKDMPRVQLPPYPERARKLFDITDKDIQRMEKIKSLLQPVNVLREDELTGQDRILGFKKEDLVKEWARGREHTLSHKWNLICWLLTERFYLTVITSVS
jgi:hypothetical protein